MDWWMWLLLILLIVFLLVLIWWYLRRRARGQVIPMQPSASVQESATAAVSAPPARAALVPEPEAVVAAIEATTPAPQAVATEAEAAPPAPEPTAQPPDDLEIIEGIGPRIAMVLRNAGITTFAQLAATDAERLTAILGAARLRLADPTTWPEQARLAAAGDQQGLKALQDQLKGGRKV